MSDRPTPETDAAISFHHAEWSNTPREWVKAEIARKLERQRDAACDLLACVGSLAYLQEIGGRVSAAQWDTLREKLAALKLEAIP